MRDVGGGASVFCTLVPINQVDDVRGVMSQNIERVMERGERLDDLVDKTGNLEQNAVKFRQTSRKVRQKWKCSF